MIIPIDMKTEFKVQLLVADSSYAIGFRLKTHPTGLPTDWLYQEFKGSNLWLYYDSYPYAALTLQNAAELPLVKNVPWDSYRKEYNMHRGWSYVILDRETGARRLYNIPSFVSLALATLHEKHRGLMHNLTLGDLDSVKDIDIELVSGDFLFE